MDIPYLALLIYAAFLVVLQVPVLVGLVVLKKHGLLRPWHFASLSALIVAVGHGLPALSILFSAWALALLGPLALSPLLGAACGLAWWFVLVRERGDKREPA